MSHRFTASHASQLPEVGTGEALAEWYQLIPAGTFQGRDGRGPYRLEDGQAVVEAFHRWACDLCVDYEHQSLNAAEKSGAIPAAGWIKALESRTDGIYGRIEWTEAAAACLAAKEYRYLSPVFNYNPKSGAVQMLTGAGLTNTPNLHLQAAASRQGEAMDELLAKLCTLLGLPATTTTEAMSTHLDKLRGLITGTEATAAASAQLAKAVGLAEGSSLVTVAQAVQSRLSQDPDPAKYVPKTVYDQTAHSLAQLQEQVKAEEAEGLVVAAMSSGKVTPAMKAWAIDYAKRTPDGFRKYLETAPTLAPASHATGSSPGATGSTELTPDQESVRIACGLDREAFLKTLNAQE